MENIYIIGDVHGCYKSLIALIDKLPNKEKSKICFVGDLVDRGMYSYEVVKFVMGNNYDCVLGNHEQMFLESIPMIRNKTSDDLFEHWLYKAGGKYTINSYPTQEDMNKHIKFIKTLPLYKEYKDYKTEDGRYLVVSHSAVGKAWEFRESEDEIVIDLFEGQVLWSRRKYFDNKEIFNVFGHEVFDEPQINDYSCAIDLGCCYSKEKLLNPRLCALEFPTMKMFTQNKLE
ncbi:metallophosphoesterase [Aliarcobacter butzleri]|uniref:metallophosphoesterase n=1 Tax=Aliarcobacter butzleri TaxID=28197 RepID=UPI00125EB9B2|nr:metallophosphoesterase [Aliarcobacter butzleri]MCT7550860.1 metallophosphoesterase [Aliarcobacter butzleri]MCT7559009.1 metallophosphoesterase [Aliarcobacter butzleri]MCT7625823.1 metallophosphoesterase [Aliarcobacter butzleri]MCT7643495.1 metallophosphoesterase [Aliarcobacter butzleri]MDN5045889.1 metallophosphoesterase [Aliarcobacter butzleri]